MRPASREPAPEADGSEDDPLVELARIVSGRSAFDQPRRRSTFADEPATPVRSETDLARDLEAELLNDLHASFAAMGDEDDDQPLTEQSNDDGGYDNNAPYGGSSYGSGSYERSSYDRPAYDRPSERSAYDSRSYERPSYEPQGYDEPAGYVDDRYAAAPEPAYGQPQEPESYAGEPYDSHVEPRFADEPTLADPEPEPEPPPPPPAPSFNTMSLRRSRASVVDYTPPPRQPAARAVQPVEPRSYALPPATPMEDVRADLSPYVPERSQHDYRGGWQEPETLSHAASAERAAEAYDRAANAYEREAKAFEREAHTYEREADGDFDPAIPPSFVRPAGYGNDYDTPRLTPGEGGQERKRRPALYGIVAVLGVVVIAAGAFLAFRGAGGGEDTPPVITADNSPIRILPDEGAVDETAQPGEAVFNQIDPGASEPSETLLPQPDQPVEDVAAAGVAVDPIAALASQNTEISQVPAAGEPRRVRVVNIGPDGQLLSNDAETVGNEAAGDPDSMAFVAPDETTDQVAPNPAADDDPIVVNPVATEQIAGNGVAAADQPAAADTPAANQAAPVDLLPQGAVATPPPGFYVQVGSVGSEEVARSQFQSLQARSPSLLANRTMVVQQAEIPGRGTFYRIQIGPMSQAEAESLRGSLRSSGVVPDAIIAQH